MAFDYDGMMNNINSLFESMKRRRAAPTPGAAPQVPSSVSALQPPASVINGEGTSQASLLDKLNVGLQSPAAQGLLTTGLSMMATPPRPEPYSNLEVLGRGGLAGVEAYNKANQTIANRDLAGLKMMLEMNKFNPIGSGGAVNPMTGSTIAPLARPIAEKGTTLPIPDTLADQLNVPRGTTWDQAGKIGAKFESTKKPTTGDAELSYQNIVKKEALGQALSKEEAAEKKAFEQRKTLGPKETATMRFEGLKDIYNNIRNIPVYDSDTGMFTFASNAEIQQGKATNRYSPPGPTQNAMKQQNLLQDIKGSIGRTQEAITGLKKDFTNEQVAQLAVVLTSHEPQTAWQNFVKSKVGQTLTPDQQTYVIRVLNLKEQAMAMRSVLGAGQGSDMMRNAIEKTIPGMLNISKSFSAEQLKEFNATLRRLERFVPKVRQVPGTGGELPSGFKEGW